jgi:hypothetical protein
LKRRELIETCATAAAEAVKVVSTAAARDSWSCALTEVTPELLRLTHSLLLGRSPDEAHLAQPGVSVPLSGQSKGYQANLAAFAAFVRATAETLGIRIPMKSAFCCFINEMNQDSCLAEAKWEIWTGSGPDDFTHSCTAHVGHMLTDAPEHRIIPWVEPVECVIRARTDPAEEST